MREKGGPRARQKPAISSSQPAITEWLALRNGRALKSMRRRERKHRRALSEIWDFSAQGALKHTLNSDGLTLDTPCALRTLEPKVSLGLCHLKNWAWSNGSEVIVGNVGTGDRGVLSVERLLSEQLRRQ